MSAAAENGVRSGSDERARAAYWEHRLTELQGLDGVGFIGYGLAFNRWMYRVRERVFRKQVSNLQIDLARANVLDIGSGTGFWVEVWKSLGVVSLTASDITEVASRQLAKRFPEYRVLRLDISSPEVTGVLRDSYDVISAIDVLFHITSDDAYSCSICNVGHLLKPGGYFVFSENLPHRPLARADLQVSRPLTEVCRELERCGLRMVQRVPLFVVMNTPFDTGWKHATAMWRSFMAPLRFLPFLGHIYGALLFPLESLLQRLLREGMSTELVICQKT